MSQIDITLQEWQYASPDSDPRLAGLSFDDDASARELALALTRSRRLFAVELAHGIGIEPSSYVGRIQLGPLTVTIQPKISGSPLINLLRYAYGLRDLALLDDVVHGVALLSFQDLLILQLRAAVQELVSRGLHRKYIPQQASLVNPRGRVDFERYVRQAGTRAAALPCNYHSRLPDSLLNRVVLAGVRLAARMTQDLELRTRLRRLAQQLETDVSTVVLNSEVLAAVDRETDRTMWAYRPAVELIRLLVEGQGLSLQSQDSVTLPGFLFDMNRFFQALVLRFLRQHLPGCTVYDEYRLRDMMRYGPLHNPRRRQSPTPRPDFVIMQNGKVRAILDAKYRDLWENELPRDMLYQLAIYALSQQAGAEAAILYPTVVANAREARIEIRDPVDGWGRSQVVLRPVHLLELEKLVAAPPNWRTDRGGQSYASYMAFGR